jgi:hypothetical protein
MGAEHDMVTDTDAMHAWLERQDRVAELNREIAQNRAELEARRSAMNSNARRVLHRHQHRNRSNRRTTWLSNASGLIVGAEVKAQQQRLRCRNNGRR